EEGCDAKVSKPAHAETARVACLDAPGAAGVLRGTAPQAAVFDTGGSRSCQTIVTAPTSRQYQANQCSFRCVTIPTSSRNAAIPTRKAVTPPATSGSRSCWPEESCSSSCATTSEAAAIAGMAMKKENVVAASRRSPH